jgi:hypothetical protein
MKSFVPSTEESSDTITSTSMFEQTARSSGIRTSRFFLSSITGRIMDKPEI